MINSLLHSIQNLIILSLLETDIVTFLFKEKLTIMEIFLAEGQICKQVGLLQRD